MGATDQTEQPGKDHRSGSTTSPWPGGGAPAPLEGPAPIGDDGASLAGTPSLESAAPFHSVGFTVSTIGYAVASRFAEILAPLGLEPREFALLRAVQATEGQSQHTIGERLRIPPSRMVAFIDALEVRRLIERRSNPSDRRARALHLTADGRDLLARAFAEAVAHERNLCGDLSEDEREQLLELLSRVAVRLGLAPGVHAAMGHSALADE